MWLELVPVLTYGFAAAVQPGPFTIYLISETARSGWRRTLPAIFAPLLSDGPIALAMVVLLSRAPGRFVQLLALPGGIYVLYLAACAWRARRSLGEEAGTAPRERTVLKAAVINFLNPNVYVGWGLVLAPLLLKAWRQAPGRGVAVVLAFYSTMIACFAALIFVVHVAGSVSPRFNRGLVGASAVALGGFGVYLIAQGVKALISR